MDRQLACSISGGKTGPAELAWAWTGLGLGRVLYHSGLSRGMYYLTFLPPTGGQVSPADGTLELRTDNGQKSFSSSLLADGPIPFSPFSTLLTATI